MIKAATSHTRRATDYARNKHRLILEYILLAVVVVLLALLNHLNNVKARQEIKIQDLQQFCPKD